MQDGIKGLYYYSNFSTACLLVEQDSRHGSNIITYYRQAAATKIIRAILGESSEAEPRSKKYYACEYPALKVDPKGKTFKQWK